MMICSSVAMDPQVASSVIWACPDESRMQPQAEPKCLDRYRTKLRSGHHMTWSMIQSDWVLVSPPGMIQSDHTSWHHITVRFNQIIPYYPVYKVCPSPHLGETDLSLTISLLDSLTTNFSLYKRTYALVFGFPLHMDKQNQFGSVTVSLKYRINCMKFDSLWHYVYTNETITIWQVPSCLSSI